MTRALESTPTLHPVACHDLDLKVRYREKEKKTHIFVPNSAYRYKGP